MKTSESELTSCDNPQGVGIFRLVTSVITLIVGAGVFSFTGDMAAAGANTGAVLSAWLASGLGYFCLMLCFFALSRVKPNLKNGIFSYAKEGFGDFAGFNSAWGYWISALLCTVSFSALLFAAGSYFFPIFEEGNNIPSIIGMSVILWLYIGIVSCGFKEATGINAVITISKFLPILIAVCAIVLFHKFDPAIFLSNFWGEAGGPDFFDQFLGALTVTSWVFVGIEAACALSGRARKNSDVGRATVISFACVLALYVIVSIVSMGVMPREQLAMLETPSLAHILEYAVGPWGGALISFGVILSLLGAMLGYTVLWSESPYEAAMQGVFTKSFMKVNKKGAPIVTLIVSGLVIQAFFIMMYFNNGTYQFFFVISLGMILVPYVLSSGYFFKLMLKNPEECAAVLGGSKILWTLVGFVGVIYSIFLVYATGLMYVVMMAILFAPGLIVYVIGKIQRKEKCFTSTADKITLAILVVATIVSIYLLAVGAVSFIA